MCHKSDRLRPFGGGIQDDYMRHGMGDMARARGSGACFGSYWPCRLAVLYMPHTLQSGCAGRI